MKPVTAIFIYNAARWVMKNYDSGHSDIYIIETDGKYKVHRGSILLEYAFNDWNFTVIHTGDLSIENHTLYLVINGVSIRVRCSVMGIEFISSSMPPLSEYDIKNFHQAVAELNLILNISDSAVML